MTWNEWEFFYEKHLSGKCGVDVIYGGSGDVGSGVEEAAVVRRETKERKRGKRKEKSGS